MVKKRITIIMYTWEKSHGFPHIDNPRGKPLEIYNVGGKKTIKSRITDREGIYYFLCPVNGVVSLEHTVSYVRSPLRHMDAKQRLAWAAIISVEITRLCQLHNVSTVELWGAKIPRELINALKGCNIKLETPIYGLTRSAIKQLYDRETL